MEKERNSKTIRKVGPYFLMKQIGKGSYSTVYEAKVEGKSDKFAVKKVCLENLTPKQLERLHLEIDVLSLIKHQNIVSLIDYQQTSRNLYLVFQHCQFTDLDVYINENYKGKLSEQKVRSIMLKVKAAFQAIRTHKIVHRDLKLGNILVTENFQIKLADFGFAKLLEQNEYSTSWVGSPLTMAPQVFLKQKYNQKCDIWSIGVITYQMIFGCSPIFKSIQMDRKQIIKSYDKQIKFGEQISKQAKDMILRMLVRDPEKRMSFSQFFNHPWLVEQNQLESVSQILRFQALKMEVTSNLNKSNRDSKQKQFIINNCQMILGYTLIQYVKSHIENSLTGWINLGKKLIDMSYSNVKVTFLGLAILLDNIKKALTETLVVIFNNRKQVRFGRYLELRNLQTWPMSEFTKRLPNFIAKSKANFQEYMHIQQNMPYFSEEEKATSLAELYCNELRLEFDLGGDPSILKILMRVRSWEGVPLNVQIDSGVLSEQALNLLVQRVQLRVRYDELCRKCGGLFKLSLQVKQMMMDQWLQPLKKRLQE